MSDSSADDLRRSTTHIMCDDCLEWIPTKMIDRHKKLCLGEHWHEHFHKELKRRERASH